MTATQMALPLQLPQSGPVKTTEQRQGFERMLVDLRQEAMEILAIANQMFQQCRACGEWYKPSQLLHDGICRECKQWGA